MENKNNDRRLCIKPLGMRTLKTGLAVILTLFLGQTILITNSLYAVIGTILGVQNTVSDSVEKGFTRVYGTILGGIIGYLFIVTFTPNPVLVGLAVILTIYLCYCLNFNLATSIAVTVCVSILLGDNNQDPLISSFFRTTDTLLGVLIGVCVNFFVARPKPSHLLRKEIRDFYNKSDQCLQEFIEVDSLELETLKQQLQSLDFLLNDTIHDKRLERSKLKLSTLKEAVNQCHDYYFHLKCLKCLSDETATLSTEERMILFESEAHSDSIPLTNQIEILFGYHFKKIIEIQKNSKQF